MKSGIDTMAFWLVYWIATIAVSGLLNAGVLEARATRSNVSMKTHIVD
jgi:hypothetical protein